MEQNLDLGFVRVENIHRRQILENGVAGFGFLAQSNVYTGFDTLVTLKLPSTVYNMLPYIISLVVLVFVSKKSRAPKAEGIPYDKSRR